MDGSDGLFAATQGLVLHRAGPSLEGAPHWLLPGLLEAWERASHGGGWHQTSHLSYV